MCVIIIIIVVFFTPWEVFTPALADGLSLVFEWKQMYSSL